MGTFETPKGSEDIRDTEPTVSSVEQFFERVRSKSRELDLAARATIDALYESDHRRVESLQGSFDQKIQELEKTLEEIRKTLDLDRDANAPRHG